MSGFTFLYRPIISEKLNSLVLGNGEAILRPDFEIFQYTDNKFYKDTVFEETDQYIVVLEGVILNKEVIERRYSNQNWGNLIWKLYLEIGETFYACFRGSFCGLLFDKHKKKWFIFNDQLSSQNLYYYFDLTCVIVSTQITDIYKVLKKNNIRYSLNVESSYMLLSYGYMLGNKTLCDKIVKLLPGSYLAFGSDLKVTVTEYYKLPISTIDYSSAITEDLIEELDLKFRQAVRRQFDKDIEYGKRHLVALSGGLDSRMTCWVAHEMGYKDQINYTFSQTNYLDEAIAKKISSDLKHEWIFKALDNGLFLKDIDEINSITGGNVLYYGLAHSNSFFRLIDFSNLGLIHSGQLGDVIVGSYLKSLDEKMLKFPEGAYSSKLLSKIPLNDRIITSLEDLEYNMIYSRGLNGINNALVLIQKYSETMSPFYDVDFFEFCLNIPINLRVGHKLYKQWIIRKYPAAAEYIWENTRLRITSRIQTISLGGRQIPIKKVLPILFNKIGLSNIYSKPAYSMNPLDYWYRTNEDLRRFQDTYFQENIACMSNSKELMDDCISLYQDGNAIEKNQILTLLSAVKLFFA